MSQFIACASTTCVAPSNGLGGATTAISTFTPATVFVPQAGAITGGAWPTGPFVGSAVANNMDNAWGGGAITIAVGDVIAAASGFWGIVTALGPAGVIAGGTTFDLIEVDKWRKMGQIGGFGTPTAGDDLAGWRGLIGGGKSERFVIDWVALTGNNQVTAQAFSICDLNGVAIPGLVFQNQAQIATNLVYQPNLMCFAAGHGPNGETCVEINQPFSVKTANAGATGTVGFRII